MHWASAQASFIFPLNYQLVGLFRARLHSHCPKKLGALLIMDIHRVREWNKVAIFLLITQDKEEFKRDLW